MVEGASDDRTVALVDPDRERVPITLLSGARKTDLTTVASRDSECDEFFE